MQSTLPEGARAIGAARLVLEHGAAVALHRLLLHFVVEERVVDVVGGDVGLGRIAGLDGLVPAATGLAALDGAPHVAVLGSVRQWAEEGDGAWGR